MKQMKRLSKMTADELLFKHQSPAERTMFKDYQIILAFFKCAGNIAKTSKLVGYSSFKNNTFPLRHRLRQISTETFVSNARNMLKAKQLTKMELKTFFENTTKAGGISKFHSDVALAILSCAVDKHGSRAIVAHKLDISEDVMECWMPIPQSEGADL